MVSSKASSTSPQQSEFTVVLKALSSARFLPEEGWQILLNVPNLGLDGVRVRTFTRWVEAGDQSLPRELVVEVRGVAPSLDEAIVTFARVARPVAMMAAFVANVRVGSLEVHLAYDSTGDTRDERQFLEVFVPDERGRVAEGRLIRQHLMAGACEAFMALDVESARVDRALRQYELALREWYLGGEWLALSHLYMAVETLTKAVLRNTIKRRQITEEALATELGVVTDDPTRPRWREILDQRVRERLIFSGDADTYKTAKEASDGLEHGFLELDKVATHAIKCADKTFAYVRQAIVDLLALPQDIRDELMTIKPMDVQSRRKIVRGRLVGVAEDPAPQSELYPLLEWSSSITSVLREGSSFQFEESDKITVRTNPEVSFRLDRLEIRGRLEDGAAAVELSNEDVRVEIASTGPQSKQLLAAVMPLVDAAVASGADVARSFPYLQVLKLFGQGIAFFQSAQTLVNERQPVEALLALRGLTRIACRFDQMSQADGQLGLVVRMLLNALNEIGADPELTRVRREKLLNGAAASGIAVPDDLLNIEASTIYSGLSVEMILAENLTSGSYPTLLHTTRPDSQHAQFHTHVEPGPFTEMVASACVMACLEMLKRASSLFEWTPDAASVEGLLLKARDLNERSASEDAASLGNAPGLLNASHRGAHATS
jgi:hypothetical protein